MCVLTVSGEEGNQLSALVIVNELLISISPAKTPHLWKSHLQQIHFDTTNNPGPPVVEWCPRLQLSGQKSYREAPVETPQSFEESPHWGACG